MSLQKAIDEYREREALRSQALEFIDRHYPAFADCDISIGFIGNRHVRVLVTDNAHVLHIMHIDLAQHDASNDRAA
jgi:hypothetical protein